MLTSILDCFWRASIMSEVFPWINLKCEEITMAVYWMQNLQLLSNTGKKCSKYNVEHILTQTIFCEAGLDVDMTLYVPDVPTHTHTRTLIQLGLPKGFNDRGCYMCAVGTSYTHVCLSLSGWDAFLWFMWSRLSHGMLWPATFKNAKRWGVYTVCLLCFLSAVISKPFLHRWPYGAVTQHTERQQCLISSFACISNYFSIPREKCYLWITVLTLQQVLLWWCTHFSRTFGRQFIKVT